MVEFDKDKIREAILKAFIEVDGEETQFARTKAGEVANYIETSLDEDLISVEEIQDIVEEKLMVSSRKDVARAYINYRYLHNIARDQYKDLMDAIAEKLSASNITHQNANVDECSFGGRMGESSSLVAKKFALERCMSTMARDNHINNEIYTHDLDHYAIGDHNCLSVPFDDLFKNGFKVRQTSVRPPQSVSTAFQLVAVIFQIQSLQQYGGVSATHLDWTMVPYVRKSFYKHYKDGLKYISIGTTDYETLNNIDEISSETPIEDKHYTALPEVYQYALDLTEKEVYQAVEGMYHNLNTLQSRSGNQLPFTSINYGTCTEPEGRMVTKALLDVSIDGLGDLHTTPIFPCGIFQCMKGVNRAPGDPNYDLFQLALKSTSRRLYPNYANCDWSGNEGYDINDPRTYFSTMGCVDGDEIITYKYEGRLYVEAFRRMWNRLSSDFPVLQQNPGDDRNLYIDVNDVEIYDTRNGFVTVKRIISNRSTQWVDLKLNHGRMLRCTADHPLLVADGYVVHAEELSRGDEIFVSNKQYCEENSSYDRHKARMLGFALCSEEDNADEFDKEMRSIFKEMNTGGRHISQEVFNWDRNARLSFLAGMIEAYEHAGEKAILDITDKRTIVQLSSDNKELTLQQMALAQSLDMLGMIGMLGTNYVVEFTPSAELSSYLTQSGIHCSSELSLYLTQLGINCSDSNAESDSTEFMDYEYAKVREVVHFENEMTSYDVETESGYFEVSSIYSHNCRTANGWDINGFGQLKDGRGNICPVTIILPTLAMEAKEAVEDGEEDNIKEAFIKILIQKIHEAKDMLLERFDHVCNQRPEAARFMYENNTMAGYDDKNIRSALKHGTLAIGQLGLAEALQILIGFDQTSEEGMEFAKQIETIFKDRCAEFKEQYSLNFGVYYTPAENLCYTAMSKFKEKYGVIPHVSENDYFTNSIHCPVWAELTPFEKIDIESQLTGYSSAGCITYVELSGSVKHNLEALEDLVNYAMDKDIPYFAINVPNDTCMDCGYCDEINDTCPVCGGSNIQRLRRVTGYLSTDYRNFNEGKQQEVEMRQDHTRVTIKE